MMKTPLDVPFDTKVDLEFLSIALLVRRWTHHWIALSKYTICSFQCNLARTEVNTSLDAICMFFYNLIIASGGNYILG